MAVRAVAVHLSARVDAYVAAMRAASASTLGFSQQTQRNLRQTGTSMMNVGRQMSTFITAPIALMGAGAVKAAVDWESSWAGVQKTVNGTESEMAALEQGFRDLTKVLPATHAEIAAVAEAAGALGIAQEDILQFTKVMIDLGETTNLTADQAATSIAQLMNIMGSAPGDVDNLASALVHLGNTGASTEDEILDMAHRIAGAGQMIGLSEADVLGFAAAMADLGIRSEQGGTAIQRVFLKMHSAVLSGSADLTEFAQVAGLSAQEFATMWEADPAQAVALFIEGLGALDAAGGDVTTMLNGVGLRGQLVQQVLFRMMGDVGGLTDALERSNMSWEDNVALLNEANLRYDTAAARFEMVRNKIVDLFIDLGNMMLPTIEKIAEMIGFLVGGFQDLPGPIQVAVGGFMAMVAAIGPILFIGGSLIKNLTSITGLFGIAASAANPYIAALIGIGVAITAGVALYGMFTAGQREVAARTQEVGDALIGATAEAWNYAAAAAGASGDVDGFAVAQRSLSLALTSSGEDGAKLTQSLGAIGQQAEDALPILIRLGLDPVESLASLAEQSGLTADAAQLVANGVNSFDSGQVTRNWRNYFLSLTEGEQAILNSSGYTMDQVHALEELQDQQEKTNIDELATQFLNSATAANEDAEALIANARARAEANNVADSSLDVYNELMGMIGGMGTEERAAALEALGLDEATRAAAGGAGELTVELMAASDAAEGFGVALEQHVLDTLAQLSDLEGGNTVDTLGRLSAAFQAVLDPQQAFIRAHDAYHTAALTFVDDIGKASDGLLENTEGAIANRTVLMDWMDNIEAIAIAQMEAGDSYENATLTAEQNTTAMRNAAIAAGFNEQEVDSLIASYLNIPETVTTAFQIVGQQFVVDEINRIIAAQEGIPPELFTQITAEINTGHAERGLALLLAHINSSSGTVGVGIRVTTPNINVSYRGSGALQGSGNMGMQLSYYQHGGYIGAEEMAVLHGDEVVLPLGNPGRMAALLGLPEVGPRVAAAMTGWMPQHGWSGSGGGGGGVVYNVAVNMPPGSDGDDVVRALRQWQRRRGPLPLAVR